MAATPTSGIGRVLDKVALDRVRHGIDWRVRRTVAEQLEDHERAKRGAKKGPDVAELVAAEVAKQLAGSAERDFTLSVLLGTKTNVRRTVTPKQYARLYREIAAVSGSSANLDMRLTQAFRALLDAEARGLGRIAGGPCNILGKLVTPQMMSGLPEGDVLEIGTLHGLFAPTLLRSLRRIGSFRKLTVVDPFTGHQMQGGENIAVDPGLTPVYEEVARWNFAELGMAEDDVRIFNGFSTDADIQTAAGDRKYAIVVVDGDHFEDGIAKDLRWVENILTPGGLAILDDYGDKYWPGVQAATDAYLADPTSKMKSIGTVWTSAFLQMPT